MYHPLKSVSPNFTDSLASWGWRCLYLKAWMILHMQKFRKVLATSLM